MSSNSNLINYKFIVAILAVLVSGMFFYNFIAASEKNQTNNSLLFVTNQKKSILQDLEFLKVQYDELIAENIYLTDLIVKEREKIVDLIAEIKKNNSETTEIKDYKKRMEAVALQMKLIFSENIKLKKENLLTQKNPSKDSVGYLKEVLEKNKFLEKRVYELSNSISKASRLMISDINITTFKAKSNGKLIATVQGKRVNFLKIKYKINDNEFAQEGEKLFYIQIIDPQNNVIGERRANNLNEKEILYTFSDKVKYYNKSIEVQKEMPINGLLKGTYFVSIFENDKIMAQSNFYLN